MKQLSIPSASELRRAIQSAEVAADAFRQAGLNERADALEEYIERARKQRFSVGVVAQAKRGKSTLINGLLGRNDDMLAPIDLFPATNVVSCFANGTPEKARILFIGDDEKSSGKIISFEDIKQYACEEHNPDNRKEVKVIEVVGPFPRLGEDVLLVDTPGADNALNRVHDIVLLEFLPKLDVVIFLVTADAPLVASEVELLKQIRKNDVRKLLFAMNKVDKVDADELRQGLQHNRKILAEAGFEGASIFEISAKNFHATGEDPGTERLIKTLGNVIEEGRAGVIAERLAGITESHGISRQGGCC
jgi:ribosome biogenesis GTPase A